MDVQYS